MARRYRATDTTLKRQVAIKILPPSRAADADRLARFRREAEVRVSLNHPNIGAIYGFENEGDVHARVQEAVEGQTLAERLNTEKARASSSMKRSPSSDGSNLIGPVAGDSRP
jgi:eukaryotic-like serine/threonine-protein kinase